MPITSHEAEVVLHSVQQMVADARTTLHSAAQPLAVLQGILELAVLRNESPEELFAASETALHEAQRVTERFDELRRIMGSCGALLGQVEHIQEGHGL